MKVCVKVDHQWGLVTVVILSTQSVVCPVKKLFEVQLSEKSGQEKNLCHLCDKSVFGNFSKRLIHLLGNSKDDGGTGYKGKTIPTCTFFIKRLMFDTPEDLRNVMTVVPKIHHDKTWDRCETWLERITTEDSTTSLTNSFMPNSFMSAFCL